MIYFIPMTHPGYPIDIAGYPENKIVEGEK
jgi:hypothetical protein